MNKTSGDKRHKFVYTLTIWYPDSPVPEIYKANDLRLLTEETGIICRTRHRYKLNHYNSKLLGKVYFTLDQYDTGTSIYSLPRKRRGIIPQKYTVKPFLFSSYGAYTEEQLQQRADLYWQNHFGKQLSSLIQAIDNGVISIDDIIPKDISDLH